MIMLIMWDVIYKTPYGATGTWNVYADTEEEAIAKVQQEHRIEMNKGYQIIRVSPH